MKRPPFKQANPDYIFILAAIFCIIFIFTIIDYLTHTLSPEYAVPSYYFGNKIIFGTIIGLITYFLIRKFMQDKKPLVKAIIFSAIVAVLLQARYALEGYALDFVIEFLIYHFLMLLPVSWLAFKYIKKL